MPVASQRIEQRVVGHGHLVFLDADRDAAIDIVARFVQTTLSAGPSTTDSTDTTTGTTGPSTTTGEAVAMP